MAKRKATVGEKIVAKVFTEPDPHLAKTIDAAVRRAVREAFKAGIEYEAYSGGTQRYIQLDITDKLNTKYGTKLGGA